MTISTTCQCVKNGYAAGSAPFQTCASQHSHFFVRFPGSLFSFEQTGLFPVHLFCISRTCFRSPERLDCMPLHLLTRSCTSRLFTAGKKKKKSRQSPEILHRRISAAPEDLFRRWAFRSAPALDFRKWQRNLSASRKSNVRKPHLNIRVATSLIRQRGALVTQAPLEPRGCFDLGKLLPLVSARIGSARPRRFAFRPRPPPPPPPHPLAARGRMMPEVPSRRDRALVTPQLDFGFHKASPLFTLTGCAGY